MNIASASHKSGSRGRRGRRGAGSGLDFELNLASVIDCLVVLIAFVLVSTSFFSIGVLEGEVAASSGQASADSEPGMVVALKRNHSIEVTVGGSRSHAYVIRPDGSDWDFDALADRLALIKGQQPKVSSAVLVAENGVTYRDVIKSMELTRLAVPSVLLGGY
jgi:biopolymer transport protein ExbD